MSHYPRLPETLNDGRPAIPNLEFLFLFGFDNTPTYSWSDGTILPEVLEGWRSLVSDKRPARIKPPVAELIKRVAANAGKLGSEHRQLLVNYGFGEQYDLWLSVLKDRMAASGQVPK